MYRISRAESAFDADTLDQACENSDVKNLACIAWMRSAADPFRPYVKGLGWLDPACGWAGRG